MHARQPLGLFLLLVLFLSGSGSNPSLLAADKPDDRVGLEKRLKQLLADRVQSAQMARAAAQAAYEAETITLGDLVTAINNLWKAELAAAGTPFERIIAAHIRHVKNFRQLDEKIETLFNEGKRGGEAEKHATAKYNLESAQIALIEACIAAGEPYPPIDPPPVAAPAAAKP